MTEFINMLLKASITAGIAALAVIIIRAAMKKAPKRWAYALWAVVFFRCLCPFSIESSFSIFNAVKNVSESAAAYEQLSEFRIPADSALPETSTPSKSGEKNFQPNPPAVSAKNNKAPLNKYTVMFAVWISGAAIMALYGAVSYIMLMRRLSTAVKTEEGVYESDRISTAFSAGFFPPKIYLPCGLSEKEKMLITAHEKAHIRRLDYIVKPAAFLALTLHWFNPTIWLAFALMTKDMELSCDETVLKLFGADEKKAYSEALLHVSMRRSGLADSYNFMPLAFAKTGIKDRIKNILKYKKPALVVTVTAAAAVVLACAVLGTNAKTNKENEPGNMPIQQDNRQVYNSVTNLSLNGNFPAYFACDLEETGSTGVINFYENPDGESSMVTGFHDDRIFTFQNAHTGKTESVRIANYGQSDYIHILGMSTQNNADILASTVFDMDKSDVKSIVLEKMYTETEGDKLYLNIMLTFTSFSDTDSPDITSLPVSDNAGSYSFDIVKGDVDGEYDLSLKVNYKLPNPFDSFAVILCGFEEAEKYVNPKLILDNPDTDDLANAVDHENAKIQKTYVGGSNRSVYISLFDGGLFGVTDFLSSYMAVPDPCISYRYEDDTLILVFDDGSELCFDVVFDTKLNDSKLVFNEKLSHRTDARSRDIPYFKDGEEFLPGEEWLEIEKQAEEERRLEEEKRLLEEEKQKQEAEKQRLEAEKQLVEKEQKRAAQKRETYKVVLSFIETFSNENLSKAYFHGANVLLLNKDGTFTIDLLARNYTPSKRPEKNYTYDEDGALILNFNDGSFLRFEPNVSNLSFDLEGSQSNTPVDVLLYDDGAVFINYENAEDYLDFLNAADSRIILQYPVSAEISEHFGDVDGAVFNVPAETAVYAAADGVIFEAGYKKGYGNTVIINHDGYGIETVYAHLGENSVKEGDKVKAGDIIGFSGSSGFTVSPSLFFGVRSDGEFVDPEKFFRSVSTNN